MLGGNLWHAMGERGKGRRKAGFSLMVRAADEDKAMRAGKFYLKAIHRARCTHVRRITDEEKREILQRVCMSNFAAWRES